MSVAVALLIVLALYFLPFIVALLRSHKQTASIFILNLFLGWTLVGWVVALAMSLSSQSPQTVIVNTGPVSANPSPGNISGAPVNVTTAAPRVAPSHEHQWVDSGSTHEGTSVAVETRRCTTCGFIEVKPPVPHEHSWGDPLPSQKFQGRLYQECAGCKEARYIN